MANGTRYGPRGIRSVATNATLGWCLLVLFWSLAGQASEPSSPMEVVVIGDSEVAIARQGVIERFGEHGWRLARTRRGTLVFRGPSRWMGRLLVSASGDVEARVPALTLSTPQGRAVAYEPGQTLGRPDGATPVRRPGGPRLEDVDVVVRLAGPAKVRAVQSTALAAVAPALRRYREAVFAQHHRRQVDRVLTRLDRLWVDGSALDGGPPLATWSDRRQAVLRFWASRTGTTEGRAMRDAVARWFRAVVMASEHPATAEELDVAEAHAGVPFPAASSAASVLPAPVVPRLPAE